MSGDGDLRYIKVEKALRAALLEALEHKRLENVTVSEICKIARCSRNAFYGHYAGRDELCAAMLDDFAETVRRICEEENVRLREEVGVSIDFVHSSIAVFREHEKLLRVLLRSDNGVFASTLRYILYDIMVSSLEKLVGGPLEPEICLDCAYVSGGTVAILERWLQEDLPIDEVMIAFESMQIPTGESVLRNVGVIADGLGL